MNRLALSSTPFKILLIALLSCGSAFCQDKALRCGTRDADAPQEVTQTMSRLPGIMARQNARNAAGETRICRITVDIDSDTYVKYDRDTAAIIQKVTQNLEKASKFYEREANIRLVVTNIRIFKDGGPDPYAGENDMNALFTILVNRVRSDANFDKRIYLYTKAVTSYRGLALIAGVYNVSPLEDIEIILHELGHNFGSFHSNNCSWPGGPLEFCGFVEGGCYDKSLERNTTYSLMSLCGGNVTGRPLHPVIKAVIKEHAETTFLPITSPPMPVSLAGNITAIKGDFYAWSPSVSAKSYEFSYATNSGFTDEVIRPAAANGISLLNQTLGTEYFVRVRALNTLGTSNWSNTVKIMIDPNQPDVPAILGPAIGTIFPSQQNVALSFSNVPGATAYRIQVTPLYDFDFANPTDQIITQNQFLTSTYLGGYKWRVKAIQGGKTGRWSETGYFSANPQLNAIALFLPIREDGLNVPRTLPFLYLPNETYPNLTVTIANNPAFANPLFQRNYTPYSEVADVFKGLPANTRLFFRVQGRPDDVINYPDRFQIDYTVEFTTGSINTPSKLTFLSEKNQSVFGRMNPKITLSKENIWLGVVDAGFIKLDPKTLTYQAFNRDQTDGLLGIGLDNAIRTDNDQNVYTLNAGSLGDFRKVKLVNEAPSGATVTQILTNNIQDYNPQNAIFWTQKEIFKETPGGPVLLRQLSGSQSIKDIRFYNNKAWIIQINYVPSYSSEILVMDLADPNQVYTINSSTSPAIGNFIEQIEIRNDGKIWLRQTDYSTGENSIAYFNGSNWLGFSAGNAPFGNRITGLGISPSGSTYVLASGNETQVYKFNNVNWETAGAALPFKDFGGDLWIDKNESFWIANRYGLSMLASEAALPVKLVEFRAAMEGNQVILKWKVTDQIDMAKYVVEHSTDAKTFRAIGETPAIDTAFYSLIHHKPAPGINYYRLKSVETDDSFAYSKAISVNLSNMDDLYFYPNPATGKLQMKIRPDLIGERASITIFTTAGKKVLSKETGHLEERESIDLSQIGTGTYVIRIGNGSTTSSGIIQVIR